MSKMFKNFTKSIEKPLYYLSKYKWCILLIAGVLLTIQLLNYSNNRNKVLDSMNNLDKDERKQHSLNVAQPLNPQSLNDQYEKVSSTSSQEPNGLAPSCNVNNVPDPSELLPKDENNEWSRLNPSGSGDLENINLLKAGYHAGVDTVGSSLRNANLQVRSEPPNPTNKVSPWLNSTIEPDLMRQPLEIGCGHK